MRVAAERKIVVRHVHQKVIPGLIGGFESAEATNYIGVYRDGSERSPRHAVMIRDGHSSAFALHEGRQPERAIALDLALEGSEYE